MNPNNPLKNIVITNPSGLLAVHSVILYNNTIYYVKGGYPQNISNVNWGSSPSGPNYTTNFYWVPTVGVEMDGEMNVINFKFGDGYWQRLPNGINTQFLKFNFTFENRSTAETQAMMHFFHEKGGVESFRFTPPGIYSGEKSFICQSPKVSYNFHDSYTINATFEEVPENA